LAVALPSIALKQDAKHFGYRMMVMERQKRAALEPVYQLVKALLPTLAIWISTWTAQRVRMDTTERAVKEIPKLITFAAAPPLYRRRPSSRSASRSANSYVFQSFNLVPVLTAYENVDRERARYFENDKICLNAFPGRNLTVFLALILIFSPLFGLTPMRAFRVAILKVPNPIS
jgi:hypothetical protein